LKDLLGKTIPILILLTFLALLFVIVRTSVFGQVEEHQHIYFEIVFLLLLAVAGELAVVYFRQPSVMILMVLGILLSPSMTAIGWGALHALPLDLPAEPPHLLDLNEVITVFAQLGAIILLFKVGLHSRIEQIFTRENILVAASGVVLPFIVGYAYASLTDGDFAYSMFLGAALTATSVGVTVALLREAGLMEERFSKVIIGAALIDDVLGLLVLAFVINVSSEGFSLMPLLTTALSAGIFLIGSVIAGRHIVAYMDRKDMSPRRFLLALAVMLFFAYAAEFIKLSAIVGAFIAGVVLNRSRHHEDINDKTYGLELLFMPIFFITLGMMVDVGSLAAYAVPILVITLLAMISKAAGCAAAAKASGIGGRESWVIGFGMSPRGEVALIVASLGLTSGVLDVGQYTIISAMALLTTMAAPPIISRLLGKGGAMEAQAREPPKDA